MSGPDDELELQAMQRQLDDAFETTRPRPGFEDELWLHMQSARPAPRRLRDALAGLVQGLRAVPAVPLAGVAALLVVVVGIGVLGASGLGRGGGGAGSTGAQGERAPAEGELYIGGFGRLPTPVFNGGARTSAPATAGPSNAEYLGPAQLTWTGKLQIAASTASVYRYREPSTSDADEFATGLGAVLRERPAGYLGSYSASDYTLKVRGTVQSPPSSPAYFIFSSEAMPAIDAAGAGPQQLADIFLAQHSLAPLWKYNVAVDSSADPTKVVYERQFELEGYGAANLVDFNGARYGLEVDLSANRPVLVSGVLPVNLDDASYRIISVDEAVRSALASSATAQAATATPVPAVQLDHAELVYVLVPAGDHSFYEPAYLFSGTVQVNGKTLTKRLLVPAVDPSERAA